MRVLVGCEYSNTVAGAFRALGHEAWSCDLLPSEGPAKWHIQGDIFDALWAKKWDLIILHPPCQYMAVCGNRWWANTPERFEAVEWTESVWNEAIELAPHVALENPVSVFFSHMGGADQYIQPWQFGHGETKKTGLLLHNLPPLEPTDIVEGREQRIWKMPPSPDRGKERSRFYPGIAQAMAEQWGQLEETNGRKTNN